MGVNSILIIAGLVVGSGLIAFFGDWFGAKLGKARISIFGLRPRRTANVITIFTGIAIAGLTLSLLVLLSESVRTRLLEMDTLISQQMRLQNNNRALETRLDDKTVQLTELERRYKEQSLLRDTLTKRLGSLKVNLDNARRAKVAAERIVTRLRDTETRLRREQKGMQEQLAGARGELKVMQSDLDAKTTELTKKEEEIRRGESILADINEQLEAVLTQISDNKETISQQLGIISRQKERMDFYETQRQEAEAELKDLQDQISSTIIGVIELRKSSLTYRRGEEVARAVIDGTRPTEEIATVVRALIARAGDAARVRGAKAAEGGSRAVEVIAGKFVSAGGVEKPFTVEDKVSAIVQEISRSGHSTAVLVVAAFNAFEAEPVKVDFELYWNQFTFNKNEKLAERRIDGSKSKDEVLSDLMAFVSEEARDKAKARGIIPQNGQYVQVSYKELIAAMDEISDSRRNRTVTALSASDCWAADQVTVRLELK